MQQSSRIDEPDYGHLMDYRCIADAARIPFARFIIQRVEIELAFVLGKLALPRPDADGLHCGFTRLAMTDGSAGNTGATGFRPKPPLAPRSVNVRKAIET